MNAAQVVRGPQVCFREKKKSERMRRDQKCVSCQSLQQYYFNESNAILFFVQEILDSS